MKSKRISIFVVAFTMAMLCWFVFKEIRTSMQDQPRADLELPSQSSTATDSDGGNAELGGRSDSSNATNSLPSKLSAPAIIAASFGIKVGANQTLEAFYLAAAADLGSGKFQAAPDLARLLSGCQAILNIEDDIRSAPDHWAEESLEHCAFLKALDRLDSSEVIAAAALAGNAEAILLEFKYPPREVIAAPRSAGASSWAYSAISRLKALADTGNRDALFLYGSESLASRYVGLDPSSGARALASFVAQSSPSDHRRNIAFQYLMRECGAVEQAEWTERCAAVR